MTIMKSIMTTMKWFDYVNHEIDEIDEIRKLEMSSCRLYFMCYERVGH